jgi:hypothetical protein
MAHVEATRHLAASQDALWATVADPRTWDKWFTVHDRWLHHPPASLAEGTRLTARAVFLGVANWIEWTVQSIVAPTSLVLVGTGVAGLKAQCEFAIAPAGSGSLFTLTGDFAGTPVRGAFVKAIERDGIDHVDRSLQLLDALASATRTSPPPAAEFVRPVLRLVHGGGPKA